MKKTFLMLLTAVVLTSCAGKKDAQNNADSTETASAVANVDLRGTWNIENIVINDTVSVRPAEVVPDAKQYVAFEDSTFSIQTNCNTIQGEYRIKGDSISFPMTLSTEMACDNMATEDAIRKVLPNIVTVEVQNDSVVRLCGSVPAECIMLVKTKVPVKAVK